MTEKTGQENVLSPERDHFFDSMRVPELPRIKKEVGVACLTMYRVQFPKWTVYSTRHFRQNRA